MSRFFSALFVFVLLLGAARAQFVGTWTQLSSMPTPRAQMAISADANGRIYLLGGYTSSGGSALASMEIFDTTTATWSSGPVLPIAVRGASAVHHEGKIYVFGGYNEDQVAAYQVFDISTGVWSQGSFAQGGWEGSAAILNGRIIVAAGENDRTGTFEFLPGSGTFTALAANAGAIGSQLVGLNNGVYLVGGGATYGPANTQLHVFSLGTQSWSDGPLDDALARTQHAAVADSNFIYVIGGGSSATNNQNPRYNTVSIYNPASDSWSTGTSLPLGLRESSATLVGDQLYVFGGFGPDGLAFGQVLVASTIPEPSTWALMALGGVWFAWIAYGRRRQSSAAILGPISSRQPARRSAGNSC